MDWTSLAVQIPVVVAFIWFATEMNKRSTAQAQQQMQIFIDTLNKENEQYEQRNRALVGAIDNLALKISEMNTTTCADDATILEAVHAGEEPKTTPRRKGAND